MTASAVALASNFVLACKLTGFPASKLLEEALQFAAKEDPPVRDFAALSVRGAVGAPNARALCAALLARGTGLAPQPYKYLKQLTLVEGAIGDSGAAAVAEVLRNGCLAECNLEQLSLLQCGVGVQGAAALGSSLMLGACTSLAHLCLDQNAGLGDAGARALCKGLATNRTLTRLSLASCALGSEGAEEVAGFINSPTCILQALDLSGNDIGLQGLRSLAVAASYSKTLLELLLCNCGLSSKSAAVSAMLALAKQLREEALAGRGSSSSSSSSNSSSSSGGGSGGGVTGIGLGGGGGGASGSAAAAAAAAAALASALAAASVLLQGKPEQLGGGGGGSGGSGGSGAGPSSDGTSLDPAALEALSKEAFHALGKAVASTECALGRVDLDGNPLTEGDAAVLVPYLKEAPPKVTLFKVPVSLTPEHFASLFKNVVAKGKKKGGKK